MDFYYSSIGRNGNLILNLSSDKRGLIPDDQLAALSSMAAVVKETFSNDLAAGGILAADTANAAHNPSLALDGNLDTWWETAPGQTNGALTLTLSKPVTFDVVSLQEAVDHRSQRIETFVIETWNGSAWAAAKPVASDETTTVGRRRLIRLETPVTTSQVRIRITGSRLEPTLAAIGLFKQSLAALAPTISGRDKNGLVTLGNAGGKQIVYTVDGSAPTASSTIYREPIALPLGGTVRAASLLPGGRIGAVATRTFSKLVSSDWKIISVDSEETAQADNGAMNAFDGNPATYWHTRSVLVAEPDGKTQP